MKASEKDSALDLLYGIKTDDPLLLHALKKSENKIARTWKLGKAPFLEIELLAAAAHGGRVYRGSVGERLLQVTPLVPAPVFFLSRHIWHRLLQRGCFGLFSPMAEIIFLPEEGEHQEHIVLHEMIHSLQGGSKGRGYLDNLEIKRVLLEGVTEEMTTHLLASDPGFYQKERALVSRLLWQTSFSLQDVFLLDSERMYRFFLENTGVSERDLQRMTRDII